MFTVLHTTDEYRTLLVFESNIQKYPDSGGSYWVFDEGAHKWHTAKLMWEAVEQERFDHFLDRISAEKAKQYLGYRIRGMGPGELPKQKWFESIDDIIRWFLHKRGEYSQELQKHRGRYSRKDIMQLCPPDLRKKIESRRERTLVLNDLRDAIDRLNIVLRSRQFNDVAWNLSMERSTKEVSMLLKEWDDVNF